MTIMTAELLFEIGTEEIPAGYLENGLAELKGLLEECLRENRVNVEGDLEVYGTPRRLVLMGRGVSTKQLDLTQEVTGPPKKGAFIAVGATKGERLFEGPVLMIGYFFKAINLEYTDEILIRGVDKRGEIKEHPTALTDAYELGKRLVLPGAST